MHLLMLILSIIIVSIVKTQGDMIDCSNYEELILKRFSLEPFTGPSNIGDFRSGKQLYHGPQEKELYLSDFFDVASVTSAEYIECEEKVARSYCWTDSLTLQVYSNGVVVKRGQNYDRYLISGENVILNSEIAIGDSKKRVLEVLGMPDWKFENELFYYRKAESDPVPGAQIPEVSIREELPVILSFIEDRLALINCPLGKLFCAE
ncbi:hypothetical protein QA601_18285 [Chitinispirillales bacterium ANBcel5]|uniref:hypothetical protein n=1 Tax=Cellulosispirillum alkaliphilum TaxID=3039283 RepID=UPI002A5460E0|nr:hypothetical protein [Chitinispirillales bacterium ANBcel5]